jgi:hypothetical protein
VRGRASRGHGGVPVGVVLPVRTESACGGVALPGMAGMGRPGPSIARPASPIMLAVLQVCASFWTLPPVEVIPTNDLPPSTTP